MRTSVTRRALSLAFAALLAATAYVPPVNQAVAPLAGAVVSAIPAAAAAGTPCSNYSDSYPLFTGWLSNSSGTKLASSTTGSVYGRVSNIDQTWDPTHCYVYRYDALVWSRNGTTTNLAVDWGALSGDGVPCRYIAGTSDYLHANAGACPASITTARNVVALNPEAVYHNDTAFNSTGDFAFAHADCWTWYGANGSGSAHPLTGATTSGTSGKPGANCGNKAIEASGSTQALVYDKSAPTLTFTAPSAPSGLHVTSYTVGFGAVDTIAGFGGSAGWSLQRQTAANTGAGTCGTFASDTAAGNLVTGTTSSPTLTSAQTLGMNSCYRWVLSATDQNGNAAAPVTSPSLITDGTAPVATFATPAAGSASSQNTTGYSASWAEAETGSGIAARSLQRQRVAISAGACGTGWASDGSAATTASPVAATLSTGYCYRWLQTLTDLAGNASAQAVSGTVLVDTTVPMANFTTPDEATTSAQAGSGYSVAWTESAGTGSVTGRSLQRQAGAVVTPGSCADAAWANDGSPVASVSPVSVTGLANGTCYRWVQTLTNSVPKNGATTSGSVLVDATAPTGSIAFPEADRPLGGDVAVTGTADDAGSFTNYTLEYGLGASPASWTTILTGTGRVTTTGALGTWPTSGLSGVYTLRLTVHDAAGNVMTPVTRTVVLENANRGDESFTTRVPFDLGGGWALDVGVSNGEARLSRDLFSIPSYGPPQALSLSYSSLETGAAGQLGVGWVSNLTQYLTFDVPGAVTVWHRPDGGRVPFGLVSGAWTPRAGQFETMAAGSGEVAITSKDQTRYVFDGTTGRLKRIENRFGKALTLTWGSGSATATDASGRATTLAIDSANNRITGASDSAGRTWGFGYAGTGSGSTLTSITDPASNVTTLGYDSWHRLTSVTRTRSGGSETIVWSVAYDAVTGRATSVTDPIDHGYASPDRNQFAYGTGTTTVKRLAAYGASPTWNTSVYTLDAWGRVTKLNDPDGYNTTWVFDAASNPTSVTRPVDATTSATTTFTYDGRGNALTETTPVDTTTSVVTATSYSAANDILTRSEADNDSALKLVTKYAYDGAGHLASIDVNCTTSGTTPPTDASTCTGGGAQDAATNLVTSYAYTANDQLAYEQDPQGRVIMHLYDAYGPGGSTYGNEVAVVNDCTSSGATLPSPFDSCTGGGTADAQTNVTTRSAYDQATTAGRAGLPTRTTDPLGTNTDITYDALGRPWTEALPGDSSVPALTRTTTYDELSNVLTEDASWVPLAGGAAVHQTTSHTYDLAGRETSASNPGGDSTDTAYDAAGDAVSTTAGWVTTTREFDGLGRAISETTPDGTSTHAFNAAGDETLTADASGNVVSHTYSLAGWALSDTSDPGGLALVTSHGYDRLGRETSTTDPMLAVTSHTYDRAGRELTATTTSGTTTTVHDRAGETVAVKNLDGSVSATVYDPLGRVTHTIANCTDTGTTQPAAGATCTGGGTLDAATNLVTSTWYDAAGTVIAVRDSTGITTRTIPNIRGGVAQSIANCTDSGATPTPNPPACTGGGTHGPVTNVFLTQTAYDAAGHAVAVLDPAGTITRYLYTSSGQLTDVYVNCTTSGTTIPSGWASCTGGGTADGTYNVHTGYAYDDAGRLIKETAPNGRVTHSAYDQAGRLCRRVENSTQSDAAWAALAIPCSTPIAGTATTNLSTFTRYDAAGRQSAITRPTADNVSFTTTRTSYDAVGRAATVITNCTNSGTALDPGVEDPGSCTGGGASADGVTNVVTDHAYDASGNEVKTTAPDPSADTNGAGRVVTRYAYDGANRLCRMLEASSSSVTDAAWTAAGCSGAITGRTTIANLLTQYTYDAAGNLASATDAAGHATAYAYDAAGHLVRTTDPDGGVLAYTYDAAGRRIGQQNRTDPPLTNSVVWTYDAAGRVATRTSNGVTVTYTYDGSGNRLTASDGTETVTATYDRLNRVLTTADSLDAGAATSYTYSLTAPQWTDPTGTYLVTLDSFDRAVVLNDPVNGSDFTWAYRADGQTSSYGQPNGNTTAYGYDAAGRLASSATTAAGPVTRASYAWTRNRAGQVLSEATAVTGDPTNGTRTFSYDPLARLNGFSDDGWTTATSYGWDAVPNRTSVQAPGGSSVPTTYDAANRPQSQNGVAGAFANDADGRLTARPDATGAAYQRMTWDSLGRLTAVLPPTGSTPTAAYSYDPLDRLRLADYGTAGRSRFRYVGLTTSVAQTVDDVSGSVTRSVGNSWTGEHLEDWTGSGSSLRVYGANGHGDTTWAAGSTGSVTGTARYDPWGTATSVTGSMPDFRFQGSWADDATKLSWAVTRWYAPAQGTFISEDSLLGTPREPDSRHLYAYGAGDPVGRLDPTGLSSTTWFYVRNVWETNDMSVPRAAAQTLICFGAAVLLMPWAATGVAVSAACAATGLYLIYDSANLRVRTQYHYYIFFGDPPHFSVRWVKWKETDTDGYSAFDHTWSPKHTKDLKPMEERIFHFSKVGAADQGMYCLLQASSWGGYRSFFKPQCARPDPWPGRVATSMERITRSQPNNPANEGYRTWHSKYWPSWDLPTGVSGRYLGLIR